LWHLWHHSGQPPSAMWASRTLRYSAPWCGAAALAWFTDEHYGHRVGQRTMRALGTGAYLLWQYKVHWTPETSIQVHSRVAKRLVNCLRENEGLYVKFGQALGSMDAILPEEYKAELRILNIKQRHFLSLRFDMW